MIDVRVAIKGKWIGDCFWRPRSPRSPRPIQRFSYDPAEIQRLRSGTKPSEPPFLIELPCIAALKRVSSEAEGPTRSPHRSSAIWPSSASAVRFVRGPVAPQPAHGKPYVPLAPPLPSTSRATACGSALSRLGSGLPGERPSCCGTRVPVRW